MADLTSPPLKRAKASEHQCTSCDYRTTTKSNLTRHIKTKHEEKTLQCPLCPYKTARPDLLQQHQTTHVKASNIQCKYCEYKTQFKQNMTRHVNTNHTQRNDEPDSNASCDHEQDQDSDAVESVDDEDMEVTDSESYYCDMCPYSSQSIYQMKRHKRVVHKMKTFHHCDLCEYMTDNIKNLHRHRVQMHATNRRRYVPPRWTQFKTKRLEKIKRLRTSRDDECDFRDAQTAPQEVLQRTRPELRDMTQRWWPQIRSRLCKYKYHTEYLFRIEDTSIDTIRKLLERVHTDQKNQYKACVAFGYFLNHLPTSDLSYFHPSFNTSIRKHPMLVQNNQDLTSILSTIEETDILKHAKKERPNSQFVPVAVVNMLVTIYDMKDNPIGSGELDLPAYIKNNKAIRSIVKDKKNSHFLLDNLCFFRALALHLGHPTAALQKPTKTLFRRYCNEMNVDPHGFRGVRMWDLRELESIFSVPIHVYSIDEDGHATLERRSLMNTCKKPLYLNLWQNHFSFIQDFSLYSKSFKCKTCSSTFPLAWRCTQHQKVCTGLTKLVFPGGVYKPTRSVFDDLALIGMDVQDRFFPYRAAYDIESLINDADVPDNTQSIQWMGKHEVMSIAVGSNLPGDEPKFFLSNGDQTKLAEEFVLHLQKISAESYRLLSTKYADVIKKIDELCSKQNNELNGTPPSPKHNKEVFDGDEEPEPKQKYKRPPMFQLRDRLDKWLRQLPVYGFNVGKYDVPVMKSAFFPALLKHQKLGFVVKKLNNYMCLSTEELRLVDICNFLAPGTSLVKFLRAFKVSESKGFFPYELITSLDVLEMDHLPPKEAFHSKLTGKDIADEDYEYCKNIWKDREMKTLKDFLRWYNLQDVMPLLEGIEKMTLYFKSRNLDLGKDGISLPGLALKDLFSEIDTFFSLPYAKDEDMYHLLKSNIVGGPSIIFHRFHERLKTYIRGNTDKPCMKIFGVDANCLYLGCLMMGMPTGFYTRRLAKNNFRAEETHKYGYLAREWLSWYEHQHDTKVIQKFTNGFEFRVGGRSIPVDGYIRDEKKVLQFQGCIFHGHNCHLTRDKDGTPMQVNPVNCKTIESLRKDTAEISQYIRDQGYELIEMWECQWHREKKINPELRNFVNTQFNSWTRRNRGEQSMEDLVLAIQNGDLFGLVECDISVEEKDRKFWEEMPPIFKNTMVGRDAISPLMKSYAEEHGLLKTPKRMLVGSMFGEKILLATPLLQFYIKSGLKITKIYQTIEYEAKTCFKHVGERVCDARRKGDADPDQAIIAEMEKLMGNSFYGKTATNQELFKKVQYFNAEQQKKELHRAIAHHSFLDLAELDDNYVEVSKAPKSVKIDLPLQIAFFVYQYAKLRMLQFYKDFMCEYFKREDFQYLSMDTDSAYVAFSADHWETLIKPEKREQYEKEKHKWFPRDDTPENAAYDRRTPLLFKEEWCGNGFVGLCSKTYYCYNGDNEEKHSCKGLQKRKNAFDQTNYLDVLTSGVSGSGTNTGFITRGTNVYTYAQNRNGLSYFYPKRYVMDDAISTTYINV